MPRFTGLAVVLAIVLGGAPAIAGRLASDGRWIRDAKGRVVLLRGLNYSGLEFGRFIGNPLGPEEEDFAQMASWGMNVVRLPVAWNYLEPEPGVFDREHLREQVDQIVRWAKRYRLGVILELHQFEWSPCTGGLGMPAWTCEGQGYSEDVVGAWAAQHDFWAGALAPTGRTLVEHFLDVWERLAKYYRRSRTVVGLGFLNEPLDIRAIGTFEHDTLYPFYRKAIARVRAQRARQMIVLEPPVTRNIGVTGAFTYTFAEDPDRRIPDPTVIFVPTRHFSNGVIVETTPGDRAKVRPEKQQVIIRRDRRVPLHTVTMRPAQSAVVRIGRHQRRGPRRRVRPILLLPLQVRARVQHRPP